MWLKYFRSKAVWDHGQAFCVIHITESVFYDTKIVSAIPLLLLVPLPLFLPFSFSSSSSYFSPFSSLYPLLTVLLPVPQQLETFAWSTSFLMQNGMRPVIIFGMQRKSKENWQDIEVRLCSSSESGSPDTLCVKSCLFFAEQTGCPWRSIATLVEDLWSRELCFHL